MNPKNRVRFHTFDHHRVFQPVLHSLHQLFWAPNSPLCHSHCSEYLVSPPLAYALEENRYNK